jgi:SpoVK/Ycf46/Vps4 family AAA+-type ATPase
MNELEKLLASRRDARVALVGLQAVVSKYLGETEKNLARVFDSAERGGSILFVDEADDLFGRRDEIAAHDGPVVLGVRQLRSIPRELRAGLVVVKAPRRRFWRRSP